MLRTDLIGIKGVNVSKSAKDFLYGHFRRFQRAENVQEFQASFEGSQGRPGFLHAVNELKGDSWKIPEETVNRIASYYKDNWFHSRWARACIDGTLPIGIPRDEFNTNNTVERSFRTFDDVFLEGCCNKRWPKTFCNE